MTPHHLHPSVPESADYTYSTVPRRCGGSHTLTYPYRRNRLQHMPQGLSPLEDIQIAMKVRGPQESQGGKPQRAPDSQVLLEKPLEVTSPSPLCLEAVS